MCGAATSEVSVCKCERAESKQQSAALHSERSYAVLRFNILVRSGSITAASTAALGCLIAACGYAGGCSVYSAELRDGDGALSTAGASGSAPNTAGGGATGAATGDAGADTGGAGIGEAGAGNSAGTSGGTGPSGGKGGAGGAATGNGGAGGGAANGGGTVIVDPALIDDLEDGDKNINIVNNPRRDGIWDVNNDMTVGGTQTPAPGKFAPTALAVADRPYADDVNAAYMKGGGFTSFGAYMNVSMRSYADYSKTPVYDASGFTGITFLAKVGTDIAITKKMRVRFISGDTDPRLGKCKLTTDTPAPAQDELCYNHYYIDMTLKPEWQQLKVKFKDFIQGSDGKINPAIDLKEMYGLEFYFATNTDFEVWIDDLSFTTD